MTRLIVGTDGSAGSARALQWALDEAPRRDAVVELVHVYTEVPSLGGMRGLSHATAPELVRKGADLVQEAGEKVIDHTIGQVPNRDGVPIDRVAVAGDPASELTGRATGDDLLVIGTRGLGSFRGLLMGSVSQKVAALSPCPVVLVNSPADAEDQQPTEVGAS